MPECRLCQLPLYGKHVDICDECRGKLGLTSIPPSRRPALPCSRCNRRKFVRVVPREHAVYAVKNGYRGLSAPMAATFKPDIRENLIFSGSTVGSLPVREDLCGMLEMYICLHCGFVEWYCQDPESIPIGAEYMSELVDHENESPYR